MSARRYSRKLNALSTGSNDGIDSRLSLSLSLEFHDRFYCYATSLRTIKIFSVHRVYGIVLYASCEICNDIIFLFHRALWDWILKVIMITSNQTLATDNKYLRVVAVYFFVQSLSSRPQDREASTNVRLGRRVKCKLRDKWKWTFLC